MSESFRDLKISEFVGKLSLTFRGLREMEAQLLSIMNGEPVSHSTESTDSHGNTRIRNLETRLKDLEIMCSILSSKEVMFRMQQLLRDRQRKRRKHSCEKIRAGAIDDVVTIPVSTGSTREVRLPEETKPKQKITKSTQAKSKSAKQRKRRLEKISQLYERMQRYRQLYNIRVPHRTEDSPFLRALEDLESKLKLLRHDVTRRAVQKGTALNLNVEDIPLPSEPPETSWKSEVTSLLFGTNEETFYTSTALQPQSVGSLLDIRRQWDQFITDGGGGSGIPVCFVLPPQSPSEEWKNYQLDCS